MGGRQIGVRHGRRQHGRAACGVLAALVLLASPAAALESTVHQTPRDAASLVSETDSVAPGKPVRVALHLRLAPGWHTYWENPGDAGAPPTLDVAGGKAGPIAFPTPARMEEGPFVTYGYTGDVLLPVTVTVPPGPASLSAHATWLVCEKICVPEEETFRLDLPAGDGKPGAEAALFATADAASPRPSPYSAHIAPDGTLFLDAPGLAPARALFFPDTPGVIDQTAAQTLRVADGRVALRLKPAAPRAFAAPLGGVLLLTDRGGQTAALAVRATPAAAPPGSAPASRPVATTAAPGLLAALGLALLGGFLLNLMPCVLPVLALKAVVVARLGGSARREIRRDAVLYTAGVVSAFAALGGAALALGAGWGVQLQHPAVAAGLACLLLAVGLSMSGVFTMGASLAGTGAGLAARGAYWTGLLAVVVAAPCTAPFMGTALAAALVLPPAAGLLVFVFLGLGLAAPYALLGAAPGLARFLPRPGAWMERLKQVLAFPMYGAALWLLWVAAQQTDPAGLAAVFAAVLLTGFACWAHGLTERDGAGRLWRGISVAAVAGTVLCAAGAERAAPARAAGAETFTPARLAALRAAHRPVFVDMTAAWCITCQVNERVALAPAAIRAAFARHGVAYLKGDWTRQDPAVSAFLAAHGRDGVPLYVWYPASGAPEVLPQVLTPSAVLARIDAVQNIR